MSNVKILQGGGSICTGVPLTLNSKGAHSIDPCVVYAYDTVQNTNHCQTTWVCNMAMGCMDRKTGSV